MHFIPIDEKKRAKALAFLAKYERFCVSLVEHIRRGGGDGFAIENDEGETIGVISVKSRMLLCIPNARFLQSDGVFCDALKAFLSDKKIACVNGEADASHLVIKILASLGRKALHINEYALMTLSGSALKNLQAKKKRQAAESENTQTGSFRAYRFPDGGRARIERHTSSLARMFDAAGSENMKTESFPSYRFPDGGCKAAAAGKKARLQNLHIAKCGAEDAEALMPLQLAYEAEEVLPPCRTQNPAVTRKNLERILKMQYVVALQNDSGAFAAKANTNAVGLRWAQIGGVYTAPDYRRRGCASLLVETLAEKIAASNRFPVLYARNGNEGAGKAYTALGFTKSGGFTIAYY